MQIILSKIKETKNCALYANDRYMKGGVYFLKSFVGEKAPDYLQVDVNVLAQSSAQGNGQVSSAPSVESL